LKVETDRGISQSDVRFVRPLKANAETRTGRRKTTSLCAPHSGKSCRNPSADCRSVLRRKGTETEPISMREVCGVLIASAAIRVRNRDSSGKSASPAAIRKTPNHSLSDDQSPGRSLSRGFGSWGASFVGLQANDKAQLNGSVYSRHPGTIEHELRRFRGSRWGQSADVDKSGLLGETIDISMNGAWVYSPQTCPRS